MLSLLRGSRRLLNYCRRMKSMGGGDPENDGRLKKVTLS
jgi:hypothetical protein